MKKRILIFTDAFSGGGAEEVMRIFAKELQDDYDVIHTVKWLGPKRLELNSNQINLNKKSSKACIPELYKIAKDFKPDFLFSSTGHNNMIVIILKQLLSEKPKVIIRESSVASQMKVFSLKSRLYDSLLMKPLYKRADKIIAQSNDIYKDLIQNYKLNAEKIAILNNPVYIDNSNISNEKNINAENKSIKLLTIGRLSNEKGLFRLMEIIKLLPKNFTLQIMGNGGLENELMNEVENSGLANRVEFLGFMEENEKLNTIKNSDIYVQTSFVEGFPNSLLQSIAYGLPAIAYNVPGGTKEIINASNGKLVKDGDIDEMVKVIKDLKIKEYNKEYMRDDISNRFGVNKIVLKLKKILNEL